MALFGRKTINAKCVEQLQLLADENVVVDFEQVDPSGRIGGSGKTRIRKFDGTLMTVALDVPTKAGRPLMISPGDLARVFIIHQTQVLRFESPVIEKEVVKLASGQSIPTLILEAPENLENGNRRRHFRVNPMASAPAIINWRINNGDRDSKDKRPWLKSRVNDISGRGAGIWIEHEDTKRIEVGKRLELMVQVQTQQGMESIKANAVVRRTVIAPEGEKPAFLGIEFEVERRDPDACIEQIVSYVTFCQLEMARIQREREG